MFDPERIQKYNVTLNILEKSDVGKFVFASDYDLLLALYLGEKRVRQQFQPESNKSKFPSAISVFEANMDIGVEHSRKVIEKAQAKFDETTKKVLNVAEEAIKKHWKSKDKDEITGNPI